MFAAQFTLREVNVTRTLAAGGISLWLFCAQAAQPIQDVSLWGVMERFGVPVGGIVFFVWWAWKRDVLMTKRLQVIEDSRVALLTGVIERNTRALNKLADVCPACRRTRGEDDVDDFGDRLK